MINLNKKQVGALLKFMPKDSTKPVLEALYIQQQEQKMYAVATNGFILAALELDTEDAEAIKGKLIRREAIERWYKLATGKSRLTTEELVKVSGEDYAHEGNYKEGEYPDILSNVLAIGEPVSTEYIGVNADYYKAVQDLADTEKMRYEFHGPLGMVVARNEGDTYVVMPVKV